MFVAFDMVDNGLYTVRGIPCYGDYWDIEFIALRGCIIFQKIIDNPLLVYFHVSLAVIYKWEKLIDKYHVVIGVYFYVLVDDILDIFDDIGKIIEFCVVLQIGKVIKNCPVTYKSFE